MSAPTSLETLRRQVRSAASRLSDGAFGGLRLVKEKRGGGVIYVAAVAKESPAPGKRRVIVSGWARSERAALLEALRDVARDLRGEARHDREELKKTCRELSRVRGLVKKGSGR